MGVVLAVCMSERKGTEKRNVGKGLFKENYGMVGDAHASYNSPRQVSLLEYESIKKFEMQYDTKIDYGAFGENITVKGLDLKNIKKGTKIRIGEDVLLEVTQIGKRCHTGCVIYQKVGKCIMPTEGIFAKVLRGGYVKAGDRLEIVGDDKNGR